MALPQSSTTSAPAPHTADNPDFAAEVRAQFDALMDFLTTQLTTALLGTGGNTSGVSLSAAASTIDRADAQLQAVMDKLDALIIPPAASRGRRARARGRAVRAARASKELQKKSRICESFETPAGK